MESIGEHVSSEFISKFGKFLIDEFPIDKSNPDQIKYNILECTMSLLYFKYTNDKEKVQKLIELANKNALDEILAMEKKKRENETD